MTFDFTPDLLDFTVGAALYENRHFRVESLEGTTIPTRVATTSGRGVAVLVVDQDERVLLIKHVRPAVGLAVYEIPRGGVDVDEDGPTAAARELFEETGLTADPDSFEALGSIYPDAGLLALESELYVFRADEGWDNEPLLTAEATAEGILEVVWVPMEEFLAAVEDGSLRDPFAAVAALRAL